MDVGFSFWGWVLVFGVGFGVGAGFGFGVSFGIGLVFGFGAADVVKELQV